MIRSAPPSTAQPTISREHVPDLALALRVGGVPDVAVRDVAGHQVARVRVGHLAGDLQGRPVQRFEQVLLADDPHLLAVSVVGERLDDVGAGALVVHVQRAERVGVLQRDLGDELAGGEVTPPFELEEESLGADHRACVEAVGQWRVGMRSLMSAALHLSWIGTTGPMQAVS